MQNFGIKLRTIRQDKGLSQENMAKSLGISVRSLRSYEQETIKPNTDFISNLIKLYTVNPMWIYDNQLPKYLNKDESVKIMDIETNEQVMSVFAPELQDSLFGESTEVKSLAIEDDSMEQTIKKGSLVIIDTSVKQFSNGIFAYKYNNKYEIKRIQVIPNNKIMVISDNKNYPEFNLEINSVEIIGKVVSSLNPIN